MFVCKSSNNFSGMAAASRLTEWVVPFLNKKFLCDSIYSVPECMDSVSPGNLNMADGARAANSCDCNEDNNLGQSQ